MSEDRVSPPEFFESSSLCPDLGTVMWEDAKIGNDDGRVPGSEMQEICVTRLSPLLVRKVLNSENTGEDDHA